MPGWTEEEVTEYTAERSLSQADKLILSWLLELNPFTLVELGCGPGMIAERALFIDRYLCTDISFGFLRAASIARPSGLFINCRADSLPVRACFADCVVAMAVLHHLKPDELAVSLGEIHRILKPEGVFILLEDWCFSNPATRFEEEAGKWRFRNGQTENHLLEENWKEELSAAGFFSREPEWVNRPFHTTTPHLLLWPNVERTVRMMALKSFKHK